MCVRARNKRIVQEMEYSPHSEQMGRKIKTLNVLVCVSESKIQRIEKGRETTTPKN